MSQVLSIESSQVLSAARFGGKAASLARLHARGFPVPPAVAVSVQAFEEFLELNGLQAMARRRDARPEAAAELRRRVLSGRLPPALAGELRQVCATLGDRLVVRSSAVGEDGRDRSWAGQFTTVVNVRPGDEVERALLRCWASLFSDQALAYRGRRSPAMGVVVQALVDARVAGVLFTTNPLTGSWREMVIEAVWGQGEALVSGQLAADRILLRRPRRRLGRLAHLAVRLRVEEVEVDRMRQTRQLAPGPTGELVWRQVAEPDAPKLDTRDVRRLGRAGLKAEAVAGAPQDMEWAIDQRGRLWVLQSRPITAAGEPRRGGEVLWTRRFAGERWTDMATPMGWSIVGGLLDWFIHYPRTSTEFLGGAPATRLLKGRPYVNVTLFRHLAFKLPGRPPPGFMMDLLPPEEVQRWTHRFAYPPDLRVYRSILSETLEDRRWRRFRWNPLTNHKAWDAWVRRLDQDLPELQRPSADLAHAAARVNQGIELLRDYIKVHVISLLMANLMYELLVPVLPPELRDDLLRCAEENRTMQANRALYAVAQGASMQDFLDEYGHRGAASSWEIFAPRWGEDPSLLEPLLRGYRRGELEDPAALTADRLEAAKRALQTLEAQVTGARGELLLRSVRLARRYLQLREDQRFHFDRLAAALKGALIEVGGYLGLTAPEQVRWLQWPEVKEHLAGRMSQEALHQLVATREARWNEDAQESTPPLFLVGDRALELGDHGAALKGLGISAGRATGVVRVLASPEEGDRLQPGDVLVARATDPGWTPLFLTASAVVLEMGSMLSHGAVLAREYGLPAVVNVQDATTRLTEGQRVTVDGGRGVIFVEQLEPSGTLSSEGSDGSGVSSGAS